MYATRSVSGGLRVAGRDLPVAQRAVEAGAQLRREASLRARAGSGRGRSPAWPTSARNRSRNPALARSGTMNRTPGVVDLAQRLGLPHRGVAHDQQPRPGDRQAAAPAHAPTNVSSAALPGSGRL